MHDIIMIQSVGYLSFDFLVWSRPNKVLVWSLIPSAAARGDAIFQPCGSTPLAFGGKFIWHTVYAYTSQLVTFLVRHQTSESEHVDATCESIGLGASLKRVTPIFRRAATAHLLMARNIYDTQCMSTKVCLINIWCAIKRVNRSTGTPRVSKLVLVRVSNVCHRFSGARQPSSCYWREIYMAHSVCQQKSARDVFGAPSNEWIGARGRHVWANWSWCESQTCDTDFQARGNTPFNFLMAGNMCIYICVCIYIYIYIYIYICMCVSCNFLGKTTILPTRACRLVLLIGDSEEYHMYSYIHIHTPRQTWPTTLPGRKLRRWTNNKS